VEGSPKRLPPEGEEAFDQDDAGGRNALEPAASVGFERIPGLLDGMAATQEREMSQQKRHVEGGRLVEVEAHRAGGRELRAVQGVRVEVEDGDAVQRPTEQI